MHLVKVFPPASRNALDPLTFAALASFVFRITVFPAHSDILSPALSVFSVPSVVEEDIFNHGRHGEHGGRKRSDGEVKGRRAIILNTKGAKGAKWDRSVIKLVSPEPQVCSPSEDSLRKPERLIPQPSPQ